MKIYQCIHKYKPHIPLFEKAYNVTDDMDFATLRRLVIDDGYASAYILQPALEDRPQEVFYTIWNYERLQWKWADEYGLRSYNLNEIKLAQIEEYKPDVFYNFSAFCDGNFIHHLGKQKTRKDIYWNSFVQKFPMTFPEYDGQISLHRPYIEYWKKQGLNAIELQPSIPVSWSLVNYEQKSIDVLFYGQYSKGVFDNRIYLINDLLSYRKKSGCDIRCHLTYTEQRPTIFRMRKPVRVHVRLPFVTFPSALVRKESFPPLYGNALYQAINKSKIVINTYGDDNCDYKSNMRLFEAIGLGAFLISEEGNYPDGFEPGVDFYTYRNSKELIDQIERVLADWPAHAQIAQRTQQKITTLYSKERQWHDFKNFASSL